MSKPSRVPTRFLSAVALSCCLVGVAGGGCADPLRSGGTGSGGMAGTAGVQASAGGAGASAHGAGGIRAAGGAWVSSGGAGGLASFTLTTIVVSAQGFCGDGAISRNEECDDGNRVAGDGCSAVCQVEVGFYCPNAGNPCFLRQTCGDGVLIASETCDDGNADSGDGCSKDCQSIEPGWTCRVPGRPCRPTSPSWDGGDGQHLCGDGIVTPDEECDCGGTAVLRFQCPTGNDDASYDGCTTQCQWGPFCGDGVVNGPEECDLGRNNGATYGKDGCTAACTRAPYCGDGRLDWKLGEECDLGDVNGVPVNDKLEPSDAGTVFCQEDCTFDHGFVGP